MFQTVFSSIVMQAIVIISDFSISMQANAHWKLHCYAENDANGHSNHYPTRASLTVGSF